MSRYPATCNRLLDELVEAEDYVVWLHRRVGHLGRRNDREGLHDAIGVSLTDLRNQKRSHIGASSTTERVAQLETLEVIAAFRLLPHHIQHRVDGLRVPGVDVQPTLGGTGHNAGSLASNTVGKVVMSWNSWEVHSVTVVMSTLMQALRLFNRECLGKRETAWHAERELQSNLRVQRREFLRSSENVKLSCSELQHILDLELHQVASRVNRLPPRM